MKKKLTSIAVTAALLAALLLAVPAAASDSGSITLNFGAEKFEGTVKAYRVFSMTGNETDGFEYNITPQFVGFSYTPPGASPPPLSGNALIPYIYSLAPGDTAASTAQSNELRLLSEALVKFASPSPPATQITPTRETTVDGTTLTLGSLPRGYYLITGTAKYTVTNGTPTPSVAFFALVSTDNPNSANLKIGLKLDGNIPPVVKKVDGGSWTDVTIGEEIDFKIDTKVPLNIGAYTKYDFIVRDTMSSGLTYTPNSVKVTVKTTPADTVITASTPATAAWSTAPGLNDTTVLTVTFNPDYFVTLPANTEIVIEYKASLNANAVTNITTPEINKVEIEYSNDPGGTGKGTTPETPDTGTDVFTNRIEIHKYTGTYNHPTPGLDYLALAGAQFVLSTSAVASDTAARIPMVAVGTNYRVALDGETGNPLMVTPPAPSLGKFTISGLGEGIYYLHEIAPPSPEYNLLEEPIKIEIDRRLTSTPGTLPRTYAVDIKVDDGAAQGHNTINVENNRGTMFPETGGIGRTIFTITGLAIMSGAIVALAINKSRTRRKDDF